MIVLELPQGHYRDLSGLSRQDALAQFAHDAKMFLAKHPQAVKYHQPCWREREVPDERTAPWGHEWYVCDAEGRLQLHSAYYDSSD